MDRLPKRNEVPAEMTWNLEDIYPTLDAWEADVLGSVKLADDIAAYEGRVTADAATLVSVMDLYEACLMKLYRLSSYASMRHDEDTADASNQALMQRAQSTEVRIAEKIAILEPEILETPENVLEQYLAEELPDGRSLDKYRVTLREIVRLLEHSLSK